MARSFYQVEYHTSYAELKDRLESVLTANGYHPYVYNKAENVWKKGTGALTAMMYIKIEYDVGKVTIQGWSCAGLGSVELNELALSGFVGAIPKKMCRGVIEQMIRAIA